MNFARSRFYYKNENTIFRVYVAKNGQPKINAQVRIYGVNTVNPPTLDIVDYTDANGLIEFSDEGYTLTDVDEVTLTSAPVNGSKIDFVYLY